MKLLRMVLLLFCSVAMDVATPLAPHAVEALDGMEEEVSLARTRRVERPASSRDRPAGPRGDSVETVRRAWRPTPAAWSHLATGTRIRKLPPAFADASAAPEDH
jgi:hypothetical protein